MLHTELLMASSSNGTFLVAMVVLVGLLLGLWSRMIGKGP